MITELKKKYVKLKDFQEKVLDILFGNRDYLKFVIISDSRTGSTLLQNSLNFHPNIIAKGEIFRDLYSKSSEEVWNEIFRPRRKKIKYLGFKLFYFHPRNGDPTVWEFLQKDPSIIIIHLRRKNILRSFVSKKIGLKTKAWTENVNSETVISLENKKIHLDPTECKEHFQEIKNYQELIDTKFKNHKLIPVYYEDLSLNTEEVVNKIFKEFHLKPFYEKSQLKKQNPENLEDLVTNYNELKKIFKNTKWENYFN